MKLCFYEKVLEKYTGFVLFWSGENAEVLFMSKFRKFSSMSLPDKNQRCFYGGCKFQCILHAMSFISAKTCLCNLMLLVLHFMAFYNELQFFLLHGMKQFAEKLEKIISVYSF